LRKYMILVMVLLCSVILVSGCTSSNNQSNETKTYAQNNISFSYPGGWEIANTTSPNAVVAVADPTTVQSGVPTTLVLIQKSNVTEGSNFESVYAANYASFFNNTEYQQVSEGNITVNGVNALENIYKTNGTGDQRQYRAVWFDSNGNIYVVLCIAKVTDFEKQQPNFNLVVNSFKAQ
jgi:predicted Zn-dependent protease